VTVIVSGGDAAPWSGARRVWIGTEPASGGRFFRVEAARAYRDRLVLKLHGIDDGNAAAGLRGRWVRAAASEAAALPRGRYWRAQLVGLEVRDERGRRIGTVDDVLPTAGPDLLRVTRPDGSELLLPLVDDVVRAVDLGRRRLVARPPRGLEGPDA
jgi:16S rRNA processing protein RimM